MPEEEASILEEATDYDALRRVTPAVDVMGHGIGFQYETPGSSVAVTDARASGSTDKFGTVPITAGGLLGSETAAFRLDDDDDD